MKFELQHGKIICLTSGDPAGVGPEICAFALRKLASDVGGAAGIKYLVIGGKDICGYFSRAFSKGDLCVLPSGETEIRKKLAASKKKIFYLPAYAAGRGKITPGAPSAASGKASCEYIFTAAGLARRAQIDAVVTSPISKEAIKLAGYSWPGHTEMLSDLLGAKHVEMAFYSNKMRLLLTTRHLPLKEAVSALTKKRVSEAARAAADFAVSLFPGSKKLSVVVLGLNPHAGEGGLFGKEEEKIISPAISEAADSVREKYPGRTIEFIGPLPADSAFARRRELGERSVFLAHYHDQGLIPFKMLYFSTGVNVTLGLPIVRTSPDHGTAFDIAGRGIADPSSMINAIKLASRITPVVLD